MKRFMLVSLMSCMLVGQTSCVWSWSEFGRGLSNAVLKSSLGTVCAVPFGFLIKRSGGLTIAGVAGAGFVSSLGLARVAWNGFQLVYNEALPTTANIAESEIRRPLPTWTDEQESYLVGSIAGNASILGTAALFMFTL